MALRPFIARLSGLIELKADWDAAVLSEVAMGRGAAWRGWPP
jgi:hypothetical protein